MEVEFHSIRCVHFSGYYFRYNSFIMELISKEEIEKITQAVIDEFVIPDFNNRGHNASGQWLESLEARAEDNKGIIRGTDYTKYLVTGSEPQQGKSNKELLAWAGWYGKNVFEAWVESKGLNINPYAVAFNIAKYGSKTYRDGGSNFLQILESDEVKEFILSRLSSVIVVNVRNIILEDLKKL